MGYEMYGMCESSSCLALERFCFAGNKNKTLAVTLELHAVVALELAGGQWSSAVVFRLGMD